MRSPSKSGAHARPTPSGPTTVGSVNASASPVIMPPGVRLPKERGEEAKGLALDGE